MSPKLPAALRGCLFDMDGVLTKTAAVHAAAWEQMFDEFLRSWSKREGVKYRGFDPVADYDEYVDGRPRLDGTRTFLKARGIDLPEGEPDDSPDAWTIHGLSNRKNDLVTERLDSDGVEVYDGSVRFVHAVRAAGMKCAVVSSSANTQRVLDAAHIADLFDARIDGVVAERQELAGKPAPDTYLAGARALGLAADDCAVFEDALAGVEAGRAGKFGYVVGVDRVGQAEQLSAHGADVVVDDLSELIS